MNGKICFLMTLVLTFTPWARGDEEQTLTAVAEYVLGGEKQTISDQELRFYARVAGFKFADPLAAYASASDQAEAEDAAYFVKEGVEEIMWNRHFALKARTAKFVLAAEHTRDVDALHRECLAAELKLRLRDNVTTLTLGDAWSLIESDRAAFARPEIRYITYVFKALAADAPTSQTEAVRTHMECLRAAVDAGEITLENAARQFSEAPSAAQSGKLGPLTRAQGLNPRFEEFVFMASVNALTPAVRLHNGYYFGRVDQIIPEQALPPAGGALPPETMEALLERHRRAAIEEAVRAARKAHPQAAGDDEALVTHHYGPRLEPTGECGAMAALLEERLLARNFFIAQNAAAIKPSEADIAQYYRDNPAEMTDLRRFRYVLHEAVVPYKPGAAVKTLDDAMTLARKARAAMINSGTADAAAIAAAGGAITISESDWAESSGVMAIDMEFLKLTPGQVTEVFPDGNRAVFAKLLEKREPPQRPLAEMRGYIAANVEARNINRLYEESLKALIEEAKLKNLWMKKSE